MKEAAGSERPLLCDGGRGPATERHACHSAPNNIVKLAPDSLMRIKFRRDALRQNDLRGAGIGRAPFVRTTAALRLCVSAIGRRQ